MPQSHQTNRHATDKKNANKSYLSDFVSKFFPYRFYSSSRAIYRTHETYIDRTSNRNLPDVKQAVNRNYCIINGHHLTMMVRGTDLITNRCDLHHEYIWCICFDSEVNW